MSVAGPVTFDPDIIDALSSEPIPSRAYSSGPSLTLAIKPEIERGDDVLGDDHTYEKKRTF